MAKIPFYNIHNIALRNEAYRRVIYTAPEKDGLQMVVMALEPGDFIHTEEHDGYQIFMVQEGTMSVFTSGKSNMIFIREMQPGMVLIIPPGTLHRVENLTSNPCKLLTFYTDAPHLEGTVQMSNPDK